MTPEQAKIEHQPRRTIAIGFAFLSIPVFVTWPQDAYIWQHLVVGLLAAAVISVLGFGVTIAATYSMIHWVSIGFLSMGMFATWAALYGWINLHDLQVLLYVSVAMILSLIAFVGIWGWFLFLKARQSRATPD